MPFGLSNAPASFWGYINKILAENLDIFIIVYLNDILIYSEDQGQAHVNTFWWVLKELRKNSLFTKLKKCCFHNNKVRFQEYVVSAQGVQMEKERINALKNWPEPKSVRNIQVFLGFANFYCHFIQSFSRIAAPPTSMFRISLRPTSVTQKLMNLIDEFARGDCGENEARTSASTKGPTGADFLSSDHVSHAVSNFISNSANNVSNYLTPDAKKAFNQLRQTFTKALIF